MPAFFIGLSSATRSFRKILLLKNHEKVNKQSPPNTASEVDI
jgi:hypothetical protein